MSIGHFQLWAEMSRFRISRVKGTRRRVRRRSSFRTSGTSPIRLLSIYRGKPSQWGPLTSPPCRVQMNVKILIMAMIVRANMQAILIIIMKVDSSLVLNNKMQEVRNQCQKLGQGIMLYLSRRSARRIYRIFWAFRGAIEGCISRLLGKWKIMSIRLFQFSPKSHALVVCSVIIREPRAVIINWSKPEAKAHSG